MARYIDADKLIKPFVRALEHQQKYGLYNHVKITEHVIKTIENEPTADVVPRSEVVKIFSIIDDIVESWKIEEHSKETGDLIRTSYNGTMIVKCLAELKKKHIGK